MENKKIIIIDDNASELLLMKRILMNDYDITTAPRAQEALQIINSAQQEFAVVMTDYHMPDMNGVSFLKNIRNISPDSVGILMTSYPDEDLLVSALNSSSVFKFIIKNFSKEQILNIIGQAFKHYNLKISERELKKQLFDANLKIQNDYDALLELQNEHQDYISRINTMLSNLDSGILIENADREILFINKLFCDMFEIPVSPEDLVGTDCTHASEQSKHLMKNPEQFVSRIDELVKNKKTVKNETVYMANGRVLSRSYLPIFDKEQFKGLYWHYEDITETKKLTEELKIRDKAIHASSNGIIIVDAIEKGLPVIFVNPAFEKITGYKKEDVIGKNLKFLHKNDDEQKNLAELKMAIREGREFRTVLRNYRKDGTLFWNELTISPIYSEEGVLTHFVGVENDITKLLKDDMHYIDR